MRHLFNIVFFSTTMLFSCNTKTVSETGGIDSSKTVIADSMLTAEKLNGCYMMNIGRDTAKLQLTGNGVEVKGHLIYKRFEKDSNEGTIDGILKDGKIRAWYRFQSEGTLSVKEVYFNIQGTILTEGYGEMLQKNDTAFFKFPSALNYEEKHPYIQTNCE